MLIGLDADTSRAQRWVGDMADRLDRPGPILDLLGDLLTDYERDVFDTDGHGTWAPLDPVTIAEKGSSRVLYDTGDLFKALTDPGTRRLGDSVSIEGTAYAGYLRAGARGAPRRDPLPTPERADVEHWADELLDHIVGLSR